MSNSDNQAYIKQAFAGVLISMMVPVTSYAEGKFLTLTMRKSLYIAIFIGLAFALSACQQNEEVPGGQQPQQNANLANDFFGAVTGIPCGGTRTVRYTTDTAVAVDVDQVCASGSVKVEVTDANGQTIEFLEYSPHPTTGLMQSDPANAGDVSVVDVDAQGRLTITCDRGAGGGNCAVHLRKARRGRNSPGTDYTSASNISPGCNVEADNSFRNFSSTSQQVLIEFSRVCGTGRVSNRPPPTASRYTMSRRSADRPTGRAAQTARWNGRKWELDSSVAAGQALNAIKCPGTQSSCEFSIKPKR